MFDRQGIWEMNQAHHRELLDVATKCRLLRMVKACRPVTIEVLWKVMPISTFASDTTGRRRQWLMEQGLAQ